VSGVLTAFHEVSVYPKKDLPFFILFTAGLCSFTALLAVLTHQYPEPMGTFARVVCSLFTPVSVITGSAYNLRIDNVISVCGICGTLWLSLNSTDTATWNSLPDGLRDPALSFDCFRQLLKMALFSDH